MKFIYVLRVLFTLLCVTAGLVSKAQNFHLVKDINASKDANPQNTTPNQPFAITNNIAFFTADDGVHGNELWKSDGSSEGTKLVMDIQPGSASSSVRNIIVLKNKIVFSALDNTSLHSIWTSDGTQAGTVLLSYIPGSLSYLSPPSNFTTVSDSIAYFLVYINSNATQQLWKTDGTPGGTKLVIQFGATEPIHALNPSSLTGFNGKLFFALNGSAGTELWSTDGTPEGTQLFKDILPGSYSSNPNGLIVVNNSLYFFATDDFATVKLWKTQGDPADLTSVAATTENALTWSPMVMGSSLYFDFGHGLAKYNTASPNGIENLSNEAGVNYTVSKHVIYFVMHNQLWKTDGINQAGFVADMPGNNLYAISDELYYTRGDGPHGIELWKSDGTLTGTVLVKDIFSGIYSSTPSHLIALNNFLLFSANDGVHGNELWKSDGTDAGTTLVKDINTSSTAGANPPLFLKNSFIVNNHNQLLISAVTQKYGSELYATDGTAGGTNVLKDILPGLANGFGEGACLTNFKNETYFFAQSADSLLYAWQTDGTSNGTVKADTFSSNTSEKPGGQAMIAGKNTVYYYIRNHGVGEIYATNGTSPKHLVKGNMLNHTASTLAVVGDTLFFDYEEDLNTSLAGRELWMTDGTPEHTKMVKDIDSREFYGSMPRNFMVFKNKLYFVADDGTGTHLWVSDGSEGGTRLLNNVLVKQQSSYISSNTLSYAVSGEKLFFLGDDGVFGTELWATDGTVEGTKLVKDIYPRSQSDINNMIDVSGTLFFNATDGVHGYELWKSDGTDAGTVMVKDIEPGLLSSSMRYPVNSNGTLFFINGQTIWQSDGTEAGTRQVEDLQADGLTYISGMVSINGKIILSATSYQYGAELYEADASVLPLTLLSFNGSLIKNDAALTWKTTNEINSDYFNVQRSIDGAAFANVGRVMAAGNTTGARTYNFTDANVTALGANALYYRLQQFDKDGKFVTSNIIKINVALADAIIVLPNPAHAVAYVRSATSINDAVITVTDMRGHIVFTKKQNIQAGTQVPVNVSGFAAGTYNVTIQAKGIAQKQLKIILQ